MKVIMVMMMMKMIMKGQEGVEQLWPVWEDGRGEGEGRWVQRERRKEKAGEGREGEERGGREWLRL